MTAVRSAGNKYSANILWPIYDFSTVLNPCINKTNKKKLKMSLCHQFKITHEGIITKRAAEEAWSEWRGII
jgi:hypothetical protein